jgi:hypothetical protein
MALWIMLAAAILVRAYLPILRGRKDSPVAQTLVREVGVRPSGPGGRWLRRDRLWAALASLLTGAACFAAAALAFEWSSRLPNLSTGNYVVTGVGFVLALLAVLAALATLVHLGGAVVAPGKIDG